jgi:hypothetical protein
MQTGERTEFDTPAHVATVKLSVVVVSFSAADILDRCLAALDAHAASADVEVIAVRAADSAGRAIVAAARQRFPRVTFIEAPEGTTVPHMRARGIEASRGEAVALLEDDCVVQPGWREAALSLSSSPHVAIAGAVEPGAYARSLDWAVYFCEYARFMLPVPASGSPPLPGNNMVCRRAALVPASARLSDGFHELFAQSRWLQAGLTTGGSNELVVKNIARWPSRQVTSVPFHHGRAYAATRFAGRPVTVRLPFALMALALPIVKIARLLRETVSRGRLAGRLCGALPWVLLFTASWSLGEAVGSVAGPGRSAAQWRS